MFLGLKQDIYPGELLPLPQYNNLWMLVNDQNSHYILSNQCPHQNSRLAKCLVKDTVQCPYHGMKFDLQGQGVGNAFNLEKKSCWSSGSLLFDQPIDVAFPIDLSYMTLKEQRKDTIQASVSVIMDVFLDIEHIPVAHPGVYDRVAITDISKITYDFFDQGSMQYVTADDQTHIIEADRQYNLGACWMTVYPGTMIEWQPGACFVTVAIPVDDGTSKVLVYKYSDTRYSDEQWILNQNIWEEAWAQDRALSEMITSPAVNNIDQLKQHHRNWLNTCC